MMKSLTCRMPFSPQKMQNHQYADPKPNSTLTTAVDARPPGQGSACQHAQASMCQQDV